MLGMARWVALLLVVVGGGCRSEGEKPLEPRIVDLPGGANG